MTQGLLEKPAAAAQLHREGKPGWPSSCAAPGRQEGLKQARGLGSHACVGVSLGVLQSPPQPPHRRQPLLSRSSSRDREGEAEGGLGSGHLPTCAGRKASSLLCTLVSLRVTKCLRYPGKGRVGQEGCLSERRGGGHRVFQTYHRRHKG